MYRDIDEALVARDADAVRITCPSCEMVHRPGHRRCGCGYDLTREHEDPVTRFKAELRRSAWRLIVIGSVLMVLPWVPTLWMFVEDPDAVSTPSLMGWMMTIAGFSTLGRGLSERRKAM